jgi:hypothetical protein
MTTPRPNRIIDHLVVKGRDLLPNPANWRTHPPEQRAATTAVLDRLGYVDELKVIQTDAGFVLMDGHLRASIGPMTTSQSPLSTSTKKSRRCSWPPSTRWRRWPSRTAQPSMR